MKDTTYRSIPAVGTRGSVRCPYFINLEYAVIRAIFIFLTPPSTVNRQQSTMTDGATGIDMTND